MEDLYYKSYMFQKNGKKKILIDYSWINQKLSGGGLKSCENLHKIFNTIDFQKQFDCNFLIKKSQKKLFKIESSKTIYAPENFYINHIFRIFLKFFLKNLGEFEIIFIPNIYSPLFKGKSKVFNLIHDGQWLVFPEYFSFFRKLWIRLNYYFINFNGNNCIFTTHYLRKQYRNILINCRTKIISLPFFTYKKKIKKIKILEKIKFNLIISSNLPHKNIELIKRIHIKRKEKFKDFYLVIAGIGQKYYHDKNNKILNLAEVSENHKYWLLNKCENFLIPSLYEGFGMIMIESMINSKHIISSYKAGLIETGNNSVNYVMKPNSEKEWNKKIFYLKKKKVKKFKPKAYTQKIIKLYSEFFTDK